MSLRSLCHRRNLPGLRVMLPSVARCRAHRPAKVAILRSGGPRAEWGCWLWGLLRRVRRAVLGEPLFAHPAELCRNRTSGQSYSGNDHTHRHGEEGDDDKQQHDSLRQVCLPRHWPMFANHALRVCAIVNIIPCGSLRMGRRRHRVRAAGCHRSRARLTSIEHARPAILRDLRRSGIRVTLDPGRAVRPVVNVRRGSARRSNDER